MCYCNDSFDVRCACQPNTPEILTCPIRISTLAWVFENDGVEMCSVDYFMGENNHTEKDIQLVKIDMVYNLVCEYDSKEWTDEDTLKFIEMYEEADCDYDEIKNICNQLGYISKDQVEENIETKKLTEINARLTKQYPKIKFVIIGSIPMLRKASPNSRA